jgi:hypothetical protein
MLYYVCMLGWVSNSGRARQSFFPIAFSYILLVRTIFLFLVFSLLSFSFHYTHPYNFAAHLMVETPTDRAPLESMCEEALR